VFRSRRRGRLRLRLLLGRLFLPVQQFLQLLARLEVRHFLRRHVALVARLRVAPLARLALAQAETAEPAQLDLLAAMKRVDDALEERVDDDFRVVLCEIGDARQLFNELRLGHAAARSVQTLLLAYRVLKGPTDSESDR